MTLKAKLLPLGTRAGLITVKHSQNTAYLLKLSLIKEDLTLKEESYEQNKDEYQILFDTGSRRVTKPDYIHPNKLKIIFLSHAHLDHTIYLGLLLRMLKRNKRKEKLYIICHENAWKPLKWWIRLFCLKIPKFIYYIPIDLEIFNPNLKTHQKENKTDLTQITKIEDIIFNEKIVVETKIAPALHSDSSVVYRLKIYDKNGEPSNKEFLDFMFSPDTSYSSNYLAKFAKNAKYWLLDAGFTKEEIDKRYEMFKKNEKGGEIVCHSSPYYSGKICEEANVENYLVGHYVWPRFAEKFENVEKEIKKRIRKTFNGNIIVTFDLKAIPLELSSG